jgi:hypothetical protein
MSGSTNAPMTGMHPLTPSERTLRARMAAYVLHSRYDSRELTAPARRAFDARFESQVDPAGVLPRVARRWRAEAAKRAHFVGLALKSARARRLARINEATEP